MDITDDYPPEEYCLVYVGPEPEDVRRHGYTNSNLDTSTFNSLVEENKVNGKYIWDGNGEAGEVGFVKKEVYQNKGL